MTELIRAWLHSHTNLDVLPESQTDIAKAFANGSMLASVLHDIGVFDSMKCIKIKSSHPFTIRKNFSLLRPALNNLGVVYTPQIIEHIIACSPDAIFKLLHNIIMQHTCLIRSTTLKPLHNGFNTPANVTSHSSTIQSYERVEQALMQETLRLKMKPYPSLFERKLNAKHNAEIIALNHTPQYEILCPGVTNCNYDEDSATASSHTRESERMKRLAMMDEKIRQKDYASELGKRRWSQFKAKMKILHQRDREINKSLNNKLVLRREKSCATRHKVVRDEIAAFERNLEFVHAEQNMFYSTREIKARNEQSAASKSMNEIELNERRDDVERIVPKGERECRFSDSSNEITSLKALLPNQFEQQQLLNAKLYDIQNKAKYNAIEIAHRHQRLNKILSDQLGSCLLAQQRWRESTFRDMIACKSFEEESFNSRIWRVEQFADIALLRRDARGRRLQEHVANDAELALARDAQHFDIERQMHETRLQHEAERRAELFDERCCIVKSELYEQCRQVILSVVVHAIKYVSLKELQGVDDLSSDMFDKYICGTQQRLLHVDDNDERIVAYTPDTLIAKLTLQALDDATPYDAEHINNHMFSDFLNARAPFESINELNVSFQPQDSGVEAKNGNSEQTITVSPNLEDEIGADALGRALHNVVERVVQSPPQKQGVLASWKVFICVLGKRFAGKSSLARTIIDNFKGLVVVSVDDLIQNILKNNHSNEKNDDNVDNDNNDDNVDNDNNDDNDDLDNLETIVQQKLRNGESLSDKLCLLVLQKHLEKLRASDDSLIGVVLDGYPETRSQAEALELLISGFVLPVSPSKYGPAALNRASMLVPYPPGIIQDKKPPFKSGISAVLWLNASDDYVACRTLGRRINSSSKKQYHFENSPPPFDEVMKESLQAVSSEFKLANELETFTAEQKKLLAWFELFHGVEHLDATKSESEMIADSVNLIKELRVLKQTSEHVIIDELKYSKQTDSQGFQVCNSDSRLDKADEENDDGHDKDDDNNNDDDNDDGDDGGNDNGDNTLEINTATAPNGSLDKATACVAVSQEISTNIVPEQNSEINDETNDDVSLKSDDSPLLKQDNVDNDIDDDIDGTDPIIQAAIEAELNSMTTLPPPNTIDTLFLPESVAQHLLERWWQLELTYTSQTRSFLRSLRATRIDEIRFQAISRARFQRFAARQDTRQCVVDEFVQAFNTIERDVRSDKDVKAELYLRVKELRNTLHELQTTKWREEQEEITCLFQGNWHVQHTQVVATLVVGMMRIEMQRHTDAALFFADFLAVQGGGTLQSLDVDDGADFNTLLATLRDSVNEANDAKVGENNTNDMPLFQVPKYSDNESTTIVMSALMQSLRALQATRAAQTSSSALLQYETIITANRLRRLTSMALTLLNEQHQRANMFTHSLCQLLESRQRDELESFDVLQTFLCRHISLHLPIENEVIFDGSTIIDNESLRVYDTNKDVRVCLHTQEFACNELARNTLIDIAKSLKLSCASSKIQSTRLVEALQRVRLESSCENSKRRSIIDAELQALECIVGREQLKADSSSFNCIDWRILVCHRIVDTFCGFLDENFLDTVSSSLHDVDVDHDDCVDKNEFLASSLWLDEQCLKNILFDTLSENGLLRISFLLLVLRNGRTVNELRDENVLVSSSNDTLQDVLAHQSVDNSKDKEYELCNNTDGPEKSSAVLEKIESELKHIIHFDENEKLIDIF